MKNKLSIHWFRQDLRLEDNLSLCYAAEKGKVIPIFIWDTTVPMKYRLGAASKWWLHHSLIELKKSLNNRLYIFSGDPKNILEGLVRKYDVASISWNRLYEPWQVSQDKIIEQYFTDKNLEIKTFNSHLLWEPWQVLKKDGSPYKIFTPFYKRGCLYNYNTPRLPLEKPSNLQIAICEKEDITIESLNLLSKTGWDKKLEKIWSIGEIHAKNKFFAFKETGLSNYKEGRNYPAKHYVSGLSPHLHWGEISPNFIWHNLISKIRDENINCFLTELGWREFSYSLLYYFPELPDKNLQEKFDIFPWEKNQSYLSSWQKGMTGYPIIDAGMRQLWQTGYMHNRVRMIVGSFLVKNLLLHWHNGEKWFWDCLVDADLASNSASWQWVAGCGADAAPYFRIFNPIIQGEKFDDQGEYTRKYLPELKDLPNKYLFSPWEAPESVLKKAGIILGKDYPHPIVNLSESRSKALAAYKSIRITK
jgi:deoxyribodipyrimidine photo-lyase